jgi:hypothetical protein
VLIDLVCPDFKDQQSSKIDNEEENKKGKSKGLCYDYECGKSGHFMPECPPLNKGKEKSKSSKE